MAKDFRLKTVSCYVRHAGGVRALLTVLIQREKEGIERELRERADVRNVEIDSWELHHPYWTDHDATCLQMNLE